MRHPCGCHDLPESPTAPAEHYPCPDCELAEREAALDRGDVECRECREIVHRLVDGLCQFCLRDKRLVECSGPGCGRAFPHAIAKTVRGLVSDEYLCPWCARADGAA